MNKKIQVTFEIEIARLPELQAFFSKSEPNVATPAPERLTFFDNAPANNQQETPTPSVQAVTKTEIRAAAAKLVKTGRAAALDQLFKKYSATKLSDLPEARYAEFLKELEEL